MNNYRMMRTKESGSLVTFLVVGIVLAALVVGGIYTIQKRSGQQPLAPTKSTSTDKKPSTPSSSPKPSTAAPASPHVTPSQEPKASLSPGATQGSPLPATGPSEDFLVSTLMFASLVGVTVAYVRSRSALRLECSNR